MGKVKTTTVPLNHCNSFLAAEVAAFPLPPDQDCCNFYWFHCDRPACPPAAQTTIKILVPFHKGKIKIFNIHMNAIALIALDCNIGMENFQNSAIIVKLDVRNILAHYIPTVWSGSRRVITTGQHWGKDDDGDHWLFIGETRQQSLAEAAFTTLHPLTSGREEDLIIWLRLSLILFHGNFWFVSGNVNQSGVIIFTMV